MSGTTTSSKEGTGSPAAASHVVPAPLALPRARALTDALVRPAPPLLDADDASLLAARLARVIGNAVARARGVGTGKPGCRRDPAGCVRIGAHQLAAHQLGSHQLGSHQLGSTTPPTQAGGAPGGFRWSARRARRTIGLAALRRLLDGDAATPAAAVAEVVADPSGPAGLGSHGPGSCADWLVSLPPAGRVAARAEATTWATQLWCALEWTRIELARLAGPPDRWWACDGRVRVALRGRADMRLEVAGGVHLSMLAGQPTPESRIALCLSALVDLLARGPAATPARVAGWWPEAGKAWIVPVDAAALSAVAGAAGRAAAALTRPVPR